MRSHIFPQSLLKEWIKYIWQYNSKKDSLYLIDLTEEKSFLVKDILDEKDINSALNNSRTFYLNIEKDLISKYEEIWNKEYEQPFFKLYKPLLNTHKQYFEGIELRNGKKLSSYNKEINHVFFKKYKENQSIVLNFLYLNIFRAQMVKESTKLIDIQTGSIEYKNLSEMQIEMNIKIDEDDIGNSFEKFKKSFRKADYIAFLIPNQSQFMPNPPIYNYGDIFFAIPFSPFGLFCLIDSQYEIKFVEEGNIKFQKTNKEYNNSFTTSDIFEYDNSKYTIDIVINSFLSALLIMWLKNYGYSKGNVYFLGNQDSVIEFMKFLKQNNFFNERKKYMNDDNNYDLSNTAFVIKR